MDLPLEPRLSIGFQHVLVPPGYDDGEGPAYGGDLPGVVRLLDALGFDSFWSGDHVAFAGPILDPLIQLAQAAALSDRLSVGTAVYLLPLRHPAPVAKQVATLDRISNGRVIFGVGVGGEFPVEFPALRRAGGGARRPAQRGHPRAAQALVGRGRGPRRALLPLPRGLDPAAAGTTGRPADLVRRPRRCRAQAGRPARRRLDVLRRRPPSATGARWRPSPPPRPSPAAPWSASAPRTCCSPGSTGTARAPSNSPPSS